MGRLALRIPHGLDASLASDPAESHRVDAFARSSPDWCLYHEPAYLAFSRANNGVADILLLSRGGRPLVALPLHRLSGVLYRSGYSGMLLPATDSETTLRLSIAAVKELLAANPAFGYECVQAALTRAYDDLQRCGVIDSLLAGRDLVKRELYSRVVRLHPSELVRSASGTIAGDELDNDLCETYEGKKRSEIRQAIRNGVRITYDILSDGADETRTAAVYARYLGIHRESWRRTGLEPHASPYWVQLSRAVQRAGGRDLVVIASNANGEPVAGVTCHVFKGRAIYWSGGSLPNGMTLKANPICLHAAIMLCRGMAVDLFELGRFDPSERSAKEQAIVAYKAQFRGTVVRLINFNRPPSNAAYRLRAVAGRLIRVVRS